MKYNRDQITNKLNPINDKFLKSVKSDWYAKCHNEYKMEDFVSVADKWFKSSKRLNLPGWELFPCVDFTLGCTHFIESTASANRWNIQVLPNEYSIYTFMGINTTEPGSLKPGVPLMVSLPQWKYVDLRSDWQSILNECEQKEIDIHLDCAWLTVANDIELDLSHPNIKSIAMSLSKYRSDWNRCGLRWSKQRRMDSITILNEYYPETYTSIASAGVHIVNSIPRDYGWDTYGDAHYDVCKTLDLEPSKIVHVAKDPVTKQPLGIGNIISKYYSS